MLWYTEWFKTIPIGKEISIALKGKWEKIKQYINFSKIILFKSNLKMIQMNLFTEQKQTHRSQNQTYGYQRGNVEGSNKLGDWN